MRFPRAFGRVPDWLNSMGGFYDRYSGIGAILILLLTLLGTLDPIYLFILIVLILVTVLAWLYHRAREKRERLQLNHRWQALAWTHYRQILSEALVRSSSGGGGDICFDFVTYYGREFEHLLKKEFYSEIQYTRGSKRQIDLIVFDIEYLNVVQQGIRFDEQGPSFAIVPLESFLSEDRVLQLMTMPGHFKEVVRPHYGLTYALPLRWGYTGIVAKLSPGCRERLKTKLGGFGPCFDLAWITNPEHSVYKCLLDEKCRVVSLDWYLPAMMLIAWDMIGGGFHRLNENQLRSVSSCLTKLIPLMDPREPLVKDPLLLAQRMHGQENLIVLGGGNWLRLVGRQPPADLIFLPIRPGYLLWCECLGFLASAQGPVEARWKIDAKNLVEWFLNKHDDMMKACSFEAYKRDDKETWKQLCSEAENLAVRQLPPVEADGFVVPRSRWEEEWNQWRALLSSRNQ